MSSHSQFLLLFPRGGPYHVETSPLIYRANQWTSFYMMGSFHDCMKELIKIFIYANIDFGSRHTLGQQISR